MLLRGVAHRRYACVVGVHTSASGCSPTRGIPGRDEYWFVRRAAGGLRPSSWCSTFPGSVLLRGVAHRRYACVVCAHTSASGCSPTRVSPGGTSTSPSAVLPDTAFIELVLDVPRERAPPGCSAPALRLRCLCAYVCERVLANPLYSREGRAPARPVGWAAGLPAALACIRRSPPPRPPALQVRGS